MDGLTEASGYESWFVSARDPASDRALWIRHTRHRPVEGPESAALWCTAAGRGLGGPPVVVKEVFGTFPADASAGASAGAGGFRGQAVMDGQSARWDLAIAGDQAPLRPLRPAALYRAPLPRTKLEAVIPDGTVTGTLEIAGREVAVDGWRGTAGHNWGSEHADTWVWLHAADFSTGNLGDFGAGDPGRVPDAWLELVLARIRVGPARSPWTAMGALGLGGDRIVLGGLGRRPLVGARPDRLTASIGGPRVRLLLSVTTDDSDPVAVTYADPRGGTRTVRHAALAGVTLSLRRPGHPELTLSSRRGAYEYGTAQPMPGIEPRPLPEG
jgi:hypothetical protein